MDCVSREEFILFSFHLFVCLAAMLEQDSKTEVQDAAVLVTEMGRESVQTIDVDGIDVEKLGRQRPEVFSSTLMEVAFVISILGSLSMAVGLSP